MYITTVNVVVHTSQVPTDEEKEQIAENIKGSLSNNINKLHFLMMDNSIILGGTVNIPKSDKTYHF